MISHDVTRACDLTREALTGTLDLDWQKPAAGLECTVELPHRPRHHRQLTETPGQELAQLLA